MARPRLYKDDAEKMRAYRARHVKKCFSTSPKIAGTIEKLAADFDYTESDVVNSLVSFALRNRNWAQQGIIKFSGDE